MLSYSGLSDGFWGEAMLTACHILNRVPMRTNKETPYELWYKKKPNLSYLKVWGCRAIVRVPGNKKKKLGERGLECIFIGYAIHSKTYRFYVIEQNDYISIHSIIESRDAIFDENRFSSLSRQRNLQGCTNESVDDSQQSSLLDVDESQQIDELDLVDPIPKRSKRQRKAKSFGPDFQVYLVEGDRSEVSSSVPYLYNVEGDPLTYSDAMASHDSAFWKEAIDDEMQSIMGNNTWVLVDLPPTCKPIGCKWIFRKKMKIDGTIDKFKARLVALVIDRSSGLTS